MSQTLLLQFLSIGMDKEPDWEKGEKEIDKLLELHMTKWNGDYLMHYINEWAEGSKSESDPDMNDRTAHVAMLREELEKLKLAWKNEFNDAAVLEFGNKQVIISGGMSYGEPPTDSYNMIQKLYYAGVSKACGFDY